MPNGILSNDFNAFGSGPLCVFSGMIGSCLNSCFTLPAFRCWGCFMSPRGRFSMGVNCRALPWNVLIVCIGVACLKMHILKSDSDDTSSLKMAHKVCSHSCREKYRNLGIRVWKPKWQEMCIFLPNEDVSFPLRFLQFNTMCSLWSNVNVCILYLLQRHR